MLILTILKEVFKTYYKGLFKVIIINLLWFLLISPIFFFALNGIYLNLYIPFLLPILFLGPLMLIGFNLLFEIYQGESFTWKGFWNIIKGTFLPGLGAIFYSVFIYIVLFVDIYYFYTRADGGFLFLALAALFLYLLIFFSITQLYFWGLMVLGDKLTFWNKIKRSFFLATDNLLQAFLWLAFIILITGVFLYITPLFPAVYFSLFGLTIIVGTKTFLDTYNQEDYDLLMSNRALSKRKED
ncbi:MAG: hypothetical protein ACQEQG_04330 [Bacillota bacterium]